MVRGHCLLTAIVLCNGGGGDGSGGGVNYLSKLSNALAA